MPVSTMLSLSDAQKGYGEIIPITGFHRCMLEAGVRRVERLVAQKFPRHRKFLQLICRSAMINHGREAHTILLESFGHPVFALQNLSYTFQPLEERKVYIVYIEQAFADWNLRKSEDSFWPTLIVGGVCSVALGLMFAHMSFPVPPIQPHAFMGFYQ